MAMPSRIGRLLRQQSGFTYLGVLFGSALLGALMAISGMLWSTSAQREKEKELLFVGNAYREAIKVYYLTTPGYQKRFPTSLDDLLLDRRKLGVVRHLRRPYPDPMTPKGEWGLVRAADGGIAGVYSVSAKRPFKRNGFRAEDAKFMGAESYAAWRFIVDESKLVSSGTPRSQ